MPVLNIRNFPPGLQKALKLEAVRRGMTLRDVIIQKLGGEPQGLALRGHLAGKSADAEARYSPELVRAARVEARESGHSDWQYVEAILKRWLLEGRK